MQAVMNLAQQVWVLAQGQLIAQGTPARGDARRAGDRGLPGPRHGGAPARARRCARDRSAALLEVRGLHAGYGAVEVLRGIDLTVGEGEAVALLGSNGAGKSTLNNVMCGLYPAWSGSVALRRRRPDARALPRRRQGRA